MHHRLRKALLEKECNGHWKVIASIAAVHRACNLAVYLLEKFIMTIKYKGISLLLQRSMILSKNGLALNHERAVKYLKFAQIAILM